MAKSSCAAGDLATGRVVSGQRLRSVLMDI